MRVLTSLLPKSCAALLTAIALLTAAAARAETLSDKFLAMGSGAEAGVFFPVGQGICELINADRLTHGLRCLNYSTGGAVYNMQALSFGTIQLGITRSDLSYQAFHGKGSFADEPAIADLRAVATLYSVPVAIIAKRSHGLTSVADIVGKRFNLGNEGSGKRELSTFLLDFMGWKRSDFAATLELDTGPMVRAFCDDEVDVLLEGLGNPARLYAELVDKCDAMFLPFPAETIAKLKAEYPYFTDMPIPGGLYAGHDDNVPSFGYRAILATSSKVHPDAIYQTVKSIHENFDGFRAKHPSLAVATPQAMANFGILIPLHDGAARYYRERGLLDSAARFAGTARR